MDQRFDVTFRSNFYDEEYAAFVHNQNEMIDK